MKEEQNWRLFISWLQNYSNQNSIVLALKQTHRVIEQNWEPRNKPMHKLLTNIWRELNTLNEEKMVSSLNGAGKTGYLHAKVLNWPLVLHYSQK